MKCYKCPAEALQTSVVLSLSGEVKYNHYECVSCKARFTIETKAYDTNGDSVKLWNNNNKKKTK